MNTDLKLYQASGSPNSRRIRIFLAEKGIDLTQVPVDLGAKEQFCDAYVAINPHRVVPTLVLADGTAIGEVPAIMRYLDEAFPARPLLGTDPKARAVIQMWERRMELEGFAPVMETVRNRVAGLKNRAIAGPHDYAQIPALIDRGMQRIRDFHADLERRLGEDSFVAGAAFSAADITAFVTIDFAAGALQLGIPETSIATRGWYDTLAGRPGFAAWSFQTLFPTSRTSIMSAYITVELNVRDAEAKNRYSAAASPILKSFGGEFLAGGPITALFGEQPFANGAIIRFPDREAALGFYNAPDYQAVLDDRAMGIDCRFSLLG